MSLHIELTEEAQHELEKMQKKSLLSSIVVSVLTFTLLTLLFFAAKIVILDKIEADVVAYTQPTSDNPDPEVEEVTTSSPQSSASPSVAKVLTSTATNTEVSVPVIDIPMDQPAQFSPSVDISFGVGGSAGDGIGGGLPGDVAKRCSLQDRLQRIKQSGGSEKYEESVVKGLRWIMKRQNADGSWSSGNKSAMTGLALLSYLAHCETPYSEEFGESCQKAIAYLIGVGKKNKGYLSEMPNDKYLPYEHAVATYAMAEAYMFCNKIGFEMEGLKSTVEKAGELIARNQATDGSWMYYYRTKAEGDVYPDLSISGWNIQAMKAVRHSEAKSDADRVLRRATLFVKKMCDPKTGRFQYKEGDFRVSMVPVGVLSLQMIQQGASREAREGIKFMEANIKPAFTDPYTYYYAAQALINRGGPAWENYGKKLGDTLVSRQQADGSWKHTTPVVGPAQIGPYKGGGNEVLMYNTCLSVLTLEVYYRFLPATGEGTRTVD